MPKASKKTTVYALFIGIDKYNENVTLEQGLMFPELGGCVADVTDVRDALKLDTSLNVKETMLLDSDATKDNIVKEIQIIMGKAKKKDAVLIYYSGHGTVEVADKSIWTSETDNRLEGIVCHYNHTDTGKFILADKEWRYLLNQLWVKTQAHIVAIFDCCHSGDNTRSTIQKLDPLSKSSVRERKVDFVFSQRKWSDFVFANDIPASAFVGKRAEDVIPEGQYIQLSASESNEPAVEVGGHGVFTTALLGILSQTGGFLSYNEINSRIRNKLYYEYEQRPKIYAPAEAAALKKSGFMKKAVSEGEDYAALTFNPHSFIYRINRGILSGVKADKTTVSVVIPKGKTVVGTVHSVSLDAAEVTFQKDDVALLGNKDYTAQLANLDNRTVRMRLIDKQKNTELPAALAVKLSEKEFAPYATLTTEADNADYDIVLWRGKAYITRVNDWFRPLVAPLSILSEKCLQTLLSYIKHISRWQYFNDLSNKNKSSLSENALKIEIFTVDKGVETLLENSKDMMVALEYDASRKSTKFYRYLKFKITNQSAQDLYVSGVLCSYDFSIDAQFLQPAGVKMLEAGESFTFEDNSKKMPDLFLFTRDQNSYWYNWEKEDLTIKVIYSTEQFQNDAFNLDALQGPHYPMKDNKGMMRGKGEEEEDLVEQGWNVLDFHFHIPNPSYNEVAVRDVETMLAEPQCADFAEALYLGLDTVTPFNSGKMTFINVAEQKQKGFLFDTGIQAANKWANYRRKSHYEDMCKKYPTRPRLVSEGDSWFQHPLLTDIIDNVGVYLPTRCIAKAGNTLSNYVKSGEFSSIIDEVKPMAFLLSGGGNDILGESIRNFLIKAESDNAEGIQVERFFNENYHKAMKDITDFYTTIFDILKLQQPNLKILVHGYDYVRPLPTGSTKTSWLGKYLDEFGVTRQGDRQAAAKYMIDGFNETLAKLAKDYANQVYYLDLRGIVGDNEWDDEIHPNDTGYQKVSLKFIKQITALMQA